MTERTNQTDQQDAPVISVIMPAYQAQQYIAQAIASVQKQTYEEPWELLVIDDCSTDGTMQVVRQLAADPRIRYLRMKKNRGPAAARNLGILKRSEERRVGKEC